MAGGLRQRSQRRAAAADPGAGGRRSTPRGCWRPGSTSTWSARTARRPERRYWRASRVKPAAVPTDGAGLPGRATRCRWRSCPVRGGAASSQRPTAGLEHSVSAERGVHRPPGAAGGARGRPGAGGGDSDHPGDRRIGWGGQDQPGGGVRLPPARPASMWCGGCGPRNQPLSRAISPPWPAPLACPRPPRPTRAVLVRGGAPLAGRS